MRRCNKCGETKPVSEFYRDASNVSGYHHYCKKCIDTSREERRQKKKALDDVCKEFIPDHLKQCSKCKSILLRSEFHRLSSSKDGLKHSCKKCERAYKQTDKAKESARAYSREPEVRERANVRRRKKRATDVEFQEKETAYRKEYQQRDYVKVKAKEHNKKYRARPGNKALARKRSKQWRQENLERQREQSRIKYIRKKGAEGYHTLDQWQVLIELCGNKCLACGEAKELNRDHIVPLTQGGTDFIDNIQPLCRQCNSIKHASIQDHRPQDIRAWAYAERVVSDPRHVMALA